MTITDTTMTRDTGGSILVPTMKLRWVNAYKGDGVPAPFAVGFHDGGIFKLQQCFLEIKHHPGNQPVREEIEHWKDIEISEVK